MSRGATNGMAIVGRTHAPRFTRHVIDRMHLQALYYGPLPGTERARRPVSKHRS